MRIPLLSIGLIAAALTFAMPTQAFEVEEHHRFGSGETRTIRILSTTDTALLTPMIESFLQDHPGVAIDYTSASSAELMTAVMQEQQPFDLALSSAMDLQIKLANDGYTQAHHSSAVDLIPVWGNWRNHVFAFSQEPASIVVSPSAFADLEIPETRQQLISLLRKHPDRFRGRIGTYDVGSSGLGYLFATQDARTSESYWRLMEIMGSLRAKLFCCSSDMIEAVARGEIAVAYNVLGSYARARKDLADRITIIEPKDYTNMMLRTAVILTTAQEPDLAGDFVDHLLDAAWNSPIVVEYPFHRYPTTGTAQNVPFRPIQLGPGLLVFLDHLKRKRFLSEWHSTVQQN
ncbi:ABC transporter substrate-binding protein [Parasedimentitalea marina]|uniref:ABC transporter substrate-binding protein n=1 Tax=Parasedimentitalea marina TaxID=2483033 RepID=A0A3T0MZU0_9RHOB|nr:extracellular solute-binding protein [Parasedimentitalea marina]AZV77290.1 ABC transporter substrate-binding protein [Parasedimentitalea marina]